MLAFFLFKCIQTCMWLNMARTVQYAPNASNMDTNGKEESACFRDGHPYLRVGQGKVTLRIKG